MKVHVVAPFGVNQHQRADHFKSVAFRSRDHQLSFTILADGATESWAEPHHNWLDLHDWHWSKKATVALKEKLIPTDCDLYLFCDNDVVVDIDEMVRDCSSDNPVTSPFMWTGIPGHTWCEEVDAKHFIKLKDGCPISTSNYGTHISQCSTVVNAKYMGALYASCMADSLLRIQEEIYFDIDVVTSVLGCALNIPGRRAANAECRPFLLTHSRVVEGYKMWHVHHIFDNPIIDNAKLNTLLQRNTPTGIDDAMSCMFKETVRGVKAKTLFNQRFNIGWFWCPWARWIDGWEKTPGWVEFSDCGAVLYHDDEGRSSERGRLEAVEGGAELSFEGKDFQWHIKHSYMGDPLFTCRSRHNKDTFVGSVMRLRAV
jgi:hypothetical protein